MVSAGTYLWDKFIRPCGRSDPYLPVTAVEAATMMACKSCTQCPNTPQGCQRLCGARGKDRMCPAVPTRVPEEQATTFNGTKLLPVPQGKGPRARAWGSSAVGRLEKAPPNQVRIIDFGNGEQSDNVILHLVNNKLCYSVFQGSNSTAMCTTADFPVNKWVHVSLVHTRKSLSATRGKAVLSWDGQERMSSDTIQWPLPMQRSSCMVAKSNWTQDPMFTGSMKDLLVWNKALTKEELADVSKQVNVPEVPLMSSMRTVIPSRRASPSRCPRILPPS